MSAGPNAATPTGQPMHVVATAGHVDHGKSALVRALTGRDPDRFAEERRRGMTIDLGFAWTTLPGAGPVVFVDVPGHVRFISNMLAGVAVVEAGVLCVDAREGWRAQTEEHLRILDLVGLAAGLVVVTKAGLVDADRIAEVRADIVRRTAGTALAGAPVVACDSIDGTGLDELRERLAAAVTAGGASGRAAAHGKPLRLWVDRSFTMPGAGTVVTGGVDHGTVAVRDQVHAVGAHGPAAARVRGIQALGRPVEDALSGTRAALNLAGIDRHAIRRGDAIVHPDEWQSSAVADATLSVLPALDHDVTPRGAYLLYLGSGEHAVRLRMLGTPTLDPGETGTVRLRWGHRLPLAAGDRYILREAGRGELVGGGELIDIAPRPGRRTTAGGDRVARPAPVADGEWVRADELERRLGVTVEPVVGEWVVAPATLESAREMLIKRLAESRPTGIDLARLDNHERAVLAVLEDEHAAEILAGYAVEPAWRSELASHPMVRLLEEQLFAPVAAESAMVPPDELRALVRRGHVVVKDGIYFAGTAPSAAAAVLADLSRRQPEGITVSEARQALGTSRKWVVPLLQLLDEAGITTRHGDRRSVRSPTPPAS